MKLFNIKKLAVMTLKPKIKPCNLCGIYLGLGFEG